MGAGASVASLDTDVLCSPEDTDNELLLDQLIARLRERPVYTLSRPPHVIYLGIDPGGGSLSDYTIMSMAHENGHDVVSVRRFVADCAWLARTVADHCHTRPFP